MVLYGADDAFDVLFSQETKNVNLWSFMVLTIPLICL
jgi:hypothetical protein